MKDLSQKGINDAVFNVVAYGAKGDNSTNDGPAIQAALDAAWNNGGGQVVLPKGIYRVMQNLKVRSNIRVTCLPGAEVHRYGDSNGVSLLWNGDFSRNGVNTNRAGWLNNGNIIIEGGVWDMRCSTATTSLSTDTFTRSNTTAPHTLGATTTGGLTWLNETSRGSGDTTNGGAGAGSTGGNLGITSNTAYAPYADLNIATVGAFPDGSCQIDVSTVNTTGQTGVVFRVKDSQNYWQYTRDGASGNARLSYWVDSVETVVTPSTTKSVAAGNTLKVVFFGSRVRAYVIASGVYTLTHDTTDSNFTTQRKVGLVITETTSRLDNWSSSSQLWTDSFDRTNSAVSLTNTSTLYPWTQQSGTLGINTNLAYAPSAGTNIATVDATSETNVEVKISTVDNTAGAGIVFRYQDANNYWWYRRHTDGNARLSKFVGGVETVITADATIAVVANDVLSVKVLGSTIRCYVNYTAATYGSFSHEVDSDLAMYQATQVGIRIDGTTARLDNFDCYAASGGYKSGACFNFGHSENILFRDLIIKDVSSQSHGIEIAGCKNVLVDNVTFNGMCAVSGRTSEAFQMDITKGGGYFGAFGPHDNTTNRDVVLRACSFGSSGSPGTQVWDRGVGSHTGTIGAWHDHLRVTDCFFETTEKAVRAYNWNNVFVRGNTLRSTGGIEVRTIDPSDTADATNLAGTATGLSQVIQNIQIVDNIIVQDQQTSSPHYGIVIRTGTDTTNGRAQGVIIRGNDIRSTLTGGIRIESCDRVVVADNLINSQAAADTQHHGIVEVNCTDTQINGNSIFLSGQHGIYVQGGSKVRVMNNYIRGANRANNSYSFIKVDTTPDDVTIGENVGRPWGSGTEPLWGIHASSGTNIVRLVNDFSGATSGDVSILTTGDGGREMVVKLAANVTGLSSSSAANITGLTVPINVTGAYKFRAFLNYQRISGTSPTIRFGINGPTANSVVYVVDVATAVGTGANNSSKTICSSYFQNTTLLVPAATSTTYGVIIEGYVDVSATGTLAIQYAAGGTSPSFTVMSGSTFIVERMDN